ncbi:MAG: sterol desaturase family protein [Bacteroidia bacterium]
MHNIKGSGVLFQNKVIEAFTRTHPLIILGMYVPFCIFLLWYFYNFVKPDALLLATTFFIGVFTWTFFEYILHRYLFHYVSESEIGKKFTYIVHGVHHEYPKDKQRLVMPPVPSIIIAGVFYSIFRIVLGDYVFAFFSGFLIGYLVYAMMHYSMHAFRAPKGYMKFLWEYHSMHHFRYPDKAFGVSSPFWDLIFGTYPPKKEKKKAVAVEA